MKRRAFLCVVWALLFSILFAIPGICQEQSRLVETNKLEWERLAKELNLASDKAAEFQAIGARNSQTRQSLITKLKQNEAELEKIALNPKPDEAKIRELVPTIIAEHNQLFESFKAQRQEEMTLLTPLQQARYLLALKRWYEENCRGIEDAQ